MQTKGVFKVLAGEIIDKHQMTVNALLEKGDLSVYNNKYLSYEQVLVDSLVDYIKVYKESGDKFVRSGFTFLSNFSTLENLKILDGTVQRLGYDLTVFNFLKEGQVLDLGDLDFVELDEHGRYVCKEDISYEDFLVKLAELIDSLDVDREDLRFGVYWVR